MFAEFRSMTCCAPAFTCGESLWRAAYAVARSLGDAPGRKRFWYASTYESFVTFWRETTILALPCGLSASFNSSPDQSRVSLAAIRSSPSRVMLLSSRSRFSVNDFKGAAAFAAASATVAGDVCDGSLEARAAMSSRRFSESSICCPYSMLRQFSTRNRSSSLRCCRITAIPSALTTSRIATSPPNPNTSF
jgi:hypothetical protein